jgi:hypothetical protein
MADEFEKRLVNLARIENVRCLEETQASLNNEFQLDSLKELLFEVNVLKKSSNESQNEKENQIFKKILRILTPV